MIRYVINKRGASPITLGKAKNYIKMCTSSDDIIITDIVASVTKYAERHVGRELTKNTWIAYDSGFQTCWEIRRKPVTSIDSITYLLSGTPTTVASTVYELDQSGLYPVIRLSDGESWPTDSDVIVDAVTINFTTEATDKLPEIVPQMLRHIADEFANRGDDMLNENVLRRSIEFYKSTKMVLL